MHLHSLTSKYFNVYLITWFCKIINYSPFDKRLWGCMQSSSKLLPSVLRATRLVPGWDRPFCPSCLSRVNQVAAQRPGSAPNDQRRPIFSPRSHHHHLLGPSLAPTRDFPAALFSHRISQWSASKCKTCCGARCQEGRPGRRPPGSQCTPPTRWSFSPRPSCLAPPPQPPGEPPLAEAAARWGWSPRWQTSAGSRAAGGSPYLRVAALAPWRWAEAACSTRCWEVWWRLGCAQRRAGWQWLQGPRGRRGAGTRRSPGAAWWCPGTKGTSRPSGSSSSAEGTPSSRCVCNPAAWAFAGGCNNWNRSDIPSKNLGRVSPSWPRGRKVKAQGKKLVVRAHYSGTFLLQVFPKP